MSETSTGHSQLSRVATGLLVLGVVTGVLLVLAAEFSTGEPTWLRFGGRLHVVLIHFPVALLLLAAPLALLGRLREDRFWERASVEAVAIGGAAACVAVGSGWANAHYEAHGGALADLVFWHRWCGVAAAALAVVAVLLASRARTAYLIVLFATAGLTGWVGHLGGSLVFGEDYFSKVLRDEPVAVGPAANEAADSAVGDRVGDSKQVAVTYADVQAILDAYCIDCHGARRQKGKLRLDTAAHVLAPREVALVVPGDPAGSELYYRITLPEDDDDFMPQEEAPLSAADIQAIHSWIATGAPAE
ncbi:MAG: c-type cytochrome domain-containing protein [Planctomycetota bacterium]